MEKLKKENEVQKNENNWSSYLYLTLLKGDVMFIWEAFCGAKPPV